MTDYIVNIGTKFDSSGAASFYQSQQKVTSTTKQASEAVKDENAALGKNTTASRAAAAAANQYTMSQKAQAAAMRGVPAQITDIVTSLQGGQRPLTVLLQQGGQLKDMFGGIRPAAVALSRSLVGMINPWTVLAAVVGSAAIAFIAGQRELESINQALIVTGRQANITAGAVQAMAVEFDDMKGVTQGYATEMANAVIATRKFSGDSVKAITELALVLEKVTGGEIEDLIKQLSALGDDPVKAALELNDTVLVLTETQLKEIKAARDAGDQKEATRLAAVALTAGLKVLNEELAANEGWWDKSTSAMGRFFAEMWDGFKGIGRATTEEKALVEAQQERLRLIEQLAKAEKSGNTYSVKRYKDEIAGQEAYIARLQKSIDTRETALRQETALKQSVQALGAAQEAHWNATATKAQKAAREIEAVRAKYKQMLADSGGDSGAAARIAEAEQLEIETIQKKYEDKTRKRVDRSLERLKERQQKYLADIADMQERAYADSGNSMQEERIINNSATLDAAKKRIDLLNAESKAYEQAGFTMNGYVSVANGVNQASIEMSKKKAIEIGLIKNANEEIDETSPIYQKAVEAARALADEEVKAAKARQQVANAAYVKQYNDDLNRQLDEMNKINELYAKGLVPGSTAWAAAMVNVNAELVKTDLLAKDIDPSKVQEIVDKLKTLGEDNVAKQNLENIKNTLGSLFDSVWDRGSEGFRDWLADMAKQLAKSAFLKMIQQLFNNNSGNPWVAAIGSVIGAMQADGGAWNKGTQFFANGGVVNGPTGFGMANGKLGVMGEAGPEAIMPLKRMSNGKMGVAAAGGGGTTNVNIGAGAVVVNASEDSAEDAQKTAAAIRQLIGVEVRKTVNDMQRSGNPLNPAFGQKY